MASTRSVAAVAAVATFALAAAACRSPAPPSADAELRASVPSGTLFLAGLHLDQLRANALFQRLSAGWAPVLDPFHDATEVLLAHNGKDLLVIAHGQFRATPAGAVLLTPELALAGAAASVQAATTQHAQGRTGAPALVAHAEPVASQPVWVVVSGGAPLPVTGNLANLNRLLRFTEYATFAAGLNPGVTFQASGIGRSLDSARALEETLRGLVSLASAATRDPDLTGLLRSAQIRRDDRTVQAVLSGSPEVVEKLLRQAVR